uniref:Uncharacterized protein n=1 Tax=Norrisiella sphaerica TaxID=552664 RepID=A0A7S2VUR5_9EUKA
MASIVNTSTHRNLSFCFGTADVEEWNKCAERLKSTTYENDALMHAKLDSLTKSLPGRTKRTLASILETVEARSAQELHEWGSKASQAEYRATREAQKIEEDRQDKIKESDERIAEYQSEMKDYVRQTKAYEEAKQKRPETEKEEEEMFRAKMKAVEEEIERLTKLIEEEKQQQNE